MTLVGIMQGRLAPPYEGRFQAFNAAEWRAEFPRARSAGLHCIEWIYEQPHEADNPLGSDQGIAEIRQLIDGTGVRVRSICADCYMTRPLVRDGTGVDAEAVAHLCWLMGRARLLGMTYIVLPFVNSSSLKSEDGRAALVTLLRQLGPQAAANGVELHLETDFSPSVFAGVLTAIGHPKVRCNYDIGNSASLGFDTLAELTALGPFLGSVHVKDRVLGGGTVPLGTGNAHLPAAFRLIRAAGFDRWYILQAARGEAGDEVAWSAANRRFVETQLQALQMA